MVQKYDEAQVEAHNKAQDLEEDRYEKQSLKDKNNLLSEVNSSEKHVRKDKKIKNDRI